MKVLIIGAAALAGLPLIAGAQQPRRQQPIEIRGTVPTPQVVTVRPREVPTYDRRVLVPSFYDHDFWQSILPGYLVVRRQMITGAVPGDSLGARRDTLAARGDTLGLRRDTMTVAPGAAAPRPTTTLPPPTQPPPPAQPPPTPPPATQPPPASTGTGAPPPIAAADGTRPAIPVTPATTGG